MISAGNIEFEPPQRKIFMLTNSIAILWAGDAALQGEITSALFYRVGEMIKQNPEVWLEVKQVALLYRDEYNKSVRGRAEQALLAPLGLTYERFLAEQSQFSAEFVDRVTSDLRAFETDGVSALIAGVDPTAGHIWLVENGDLYSQDTAGFAAIGSGAWHSESQLMFAGHTVHKVFSETMFLTYLSKKRAEVAPGVGAETDMVVIFALGGSYPVDSTLQDVLHNEYESVVERQTAAVSESTKNITEHVDKLIEDVAQQTQALPETPTDGPS